MSGAGAPVSLVLKAVSHPRLGEIRIEHDLFAIGRLEEPFASRLGEAAARLSRRHARIFRQDGKVFIADLGSLNGTRLNDRPLENDVAPLNDGDVVTLGGEVRLRVQMEREAAETRLAGAQRVRLTLIPLDASCGLETIIVERFPFLIARIGNLFEQYRDRFPDAVRKLSRRHAVIALKGAEVYLEDLESSNGTFVSGARLDERARPLAEGDTVAFASEQFAYRVHIERGSEATRPLAQENEDADDGTLIAPRAAGAQPASDARRKPAPAPARPDVREKVEPRLEEPDARAPDARDVAPAAPARAENAAKSADTGNRTRFVSSADSFLNVFCADEEAAKREQEAGETAAVPALPGRRSAFARLRTTASQLWRAIGIPASTDRKAAWGAGAALAVVAALLAGNYLFGTDRREIKALLDESRYEDSARVANRYLERKPDDREVNLWGGTAVTKAIAPGWLALLERGDFEQAAQYLRTERDRYPFVADAQEVIGTLDWAGAVEAHVADRGGPDGPIVLFRHEEEIKWLVEAWDRRSYRRQQLMEQIVQYAPAFEPVQRRVYSSLRALRSENALYVKAIAGLKSELAAALETDDRRSMARLIAEFRQSYPRVANIEALEADVARYEILATRLEEKDLLELVRLGRSTHFATPLFAQHVDRWLARSLPPEPVIARHAAAGAAWDAGQHDEAVSLLQPLTSEPWGEVAQKQIARYGQVLKDYRTLVDARGTPAYWDRLLAVWGTLRPHEDAHLIRTLEPDFRTHREQLVPELDATFTRIEAQWAEYQNDGGIPGVVRVEGRVSDRYSRQAGRLSKAYEQVARGARTYELLQVETPQPWAVLQIEISNEVQRQRRWLEELDIVLEPALLEAKLNLLPKAPEESLWVRSTTDRSKD